MSPASLIRHHSGRMAGPARWYLAGLAMVSLCLLAAHFAVQEHVQKNMRLAVHDWLQESGGDVQHVRYRLLRGALTLEKVHWVGSTDSGMSLDVSQVFIQTSSRAIASREPSFSSLRFEHPVLNLRRATLLAWLRGDPANGLHATTSLLPRAEAVFVNDMSVQLMSDAELPLAYGRPMRGISGRLASDGMQLVGKLGAGSLRFDGRIDDGGKLVGNIALFGLPMDSLASWLGTSSHGGVTASGDLLVLGDWVKRDVGMQGRLSLKDVQDVASLDLQGGSSASGMHLEMTCDQVPLLGLPLDWPMLAGRTLVAGKLNGVLNVARDWQQAGWNTDINGDLLDVLLDSEHLPLWQIGRVQLSKAQLLSENGRLTVEEMLLADADIVMNAFPSPDDVSKVLTPEIAKLKLQGIRPQLYFADGSELVLPEMKGSGRVGSLGHMKLASLRREADVADGPEESWKLTLEGDVFAVWQAQLKAKHVPVVRLRPLLPQISLPGEQGVPEYSGHADLSLQLTSAAHGPKLAGGAVLHDVRMVQGGDQLSAARIEVGINHAGSDGVRQLSRVHLNDWQYQVALRPLPRLVSSTPAAIAPAPVANAPEVNTQALPLEVKDQESTVAPPSISSPALNWQLDEFSAENGRISLGQPDALFAEKLLLRAHHLSSGTLSKFTLSGEFAGGDMRSQGKLQLQPGFIMASKTYINNALPFVFNDWMQLSGMPHFVRGRINAVLSIAPDGPAVDRAYSGKLIVGLYQGAMEVGTFPEDPMVQRAGYRTQGLFERLNPSRELKLSIPFQGAWGGSLLIDTLGEAALATIKETADARPVQKQADPPINKVTRLRLQGKRGFSHNERVRLRQMIKQLHADKTLIVELVPQLGTAELDAEMVERVVYSQGLVERFMRRMGIGSKRIFPVWPQTIHQRGDAPGLLLRARAS